jgi:hypothetical protein
VLHEAPQELFGGECEFKPHGQLHTQVFNWDR